MLNHVELLGRLAQDPELRHTGSGTPVTSFDLAVNVPSADQNTTADFIPIVCWQKTAEFAARYLSKGRQIVVEGKIKPRKYTDQDGKNRKVVEVVASRLYFADSNNSGAENTEPPQQDDDFVPLEQDNDLPF